MASCGCAHCVLASTIGCAKVIKDQTCSESPPHTIQEFTVTVGLCFLGGLGLFSIHISYAIFVIIPIAYFLPERKLTE